MRKLLPAFLLGMSVSAMAQNDASPCCNIIGVDAKSNIITARDKVSGQLYQFKADALDTRNIQINDAVSISNGRLTSVAGAKRNYANAKVTYGAPCCLVVSIQADAGAPCCNLVSYAGQGSNITGSILVPKHISNTIKIGDPVFAEPAGAEPAGAEPAGMSGRLKGIAVVYASNVAYGYPIQGSAGNAATSDGDAAPCCQVINTDNTTQNVLARDVKSGKLYHFKADAADINTIKTNDMVTVSNGMITSINGSKRTYVNARVNAGAPCCQVVSIQADAGAPCCSMVTYSVKGSNQLYKFKAPKEITNTIRVGDPVYAEPAGKPSAVANSSVARLGGMAVVYSNDSDGLSAYGYPVESGDGSTGNTASAALWKITPNTARGVTGRFSFANLPKDAEWTVEFYTQPDIKHLQTFYHSSTRSAHHTLSPGNYTIKFSYITVLDVPIQQGHDTELKYGLLNVVSDGTWQLYHNDKSITTKYKPAKVALPLGTYRMNLGGKDYTVVIREGKTEEF